MSRSEDKKNPFIIGPTQHVLDTADFERLADLIEAFLISDDQAMRTWPQQVSQRTDA